MNELELRALVERMVADLMGQAPTPQVKAADYKPLERGQESGSGGEMLPDITEVDLRRQYLMPNPQNGPAFLDLKLKMPARLGLSRAGARYKTETMLRMRADHAAAQDSVFSLVDEDHTIDVSEPIMAAILMETPFVVLCREDCKGLCPTCGANLNEGDCGCAAKREAEKLAESPFAALADLNLEDDDEK